MASGHRITTHRLQPRACPPHTGNAAVGQVRHRYFRRVCSRFDKYAKHYLAFGHFASTVIWLKYTRQRNLAFGATQEYRLAMHDSGTCRGDIGC